MEPTEKHKLINPKLPLRILMILLICMADIAWSATVLYAWKNNGTVISVKAASDNIPRIFMQNVIVSAVPILLFIICLIVLKKQFFSQMYFQVCSKKQAIIIAVLSVILILLALYCLVTKADKITVLYNLLYYTVFIAFTEEFVVRDVCTYLLRTEKKQPALSDPQCPFCRNAYLLICRMGNDHPALSDYFCLLSNARISCDGLYLPVLKGKVQNHLGTGTSTCHPGFLSGTGI